MKETDYYAEYSTGEEQYTGGAPPKETDKKKVMSRKEIIHCVNLIRNGTPEEKEAAMTEILVRNEPYIKSLIRKLYPTYSNKYMEDMISCGHIGIICALCKADPPYDPTISSFTTFVSKYIIHEISDCISQMVHNASPHYSATAKKINRAVAVLQHRGIANPTLTDIMAETKLGSDAIQTVLLMQSANSALPLNHPNVMDLPANEQESPLEIVERLELLDDLHKALQTLPEKECLAVELQYGLNGRKKLTQADIAKRLGMSVYQVHRLLANAYQRLYSNPKLQSHYERECRQHERDYDTLVEETIIPLIISANAIEQEISILADIPLEEIIL